MPRELTKTEKGVLGFLGAVAAIFGIRYLMRAAPGEYVCPYCGEKFPTLEELQEHVRTEHPGERIPIDISWD
jgi:hypothetical protein